GAGGDAALPAEFGDDRRKEQRERGAGVDADSHGDERHRDDNPAVVERKRHSLPARPAAHGRRVQEAALTAPTGASPLMMAATCRTVSDDWCSIACGVNPPICGVAITCGRLIRRAADIQRGACDAVVA